MTTKNQPGARVSEYILEQCVGAGTFGEVWQARHHVWDNERVAIKLPTEPEYVRFLQREGIVVHGLRHPNIIRIRGLDPYADTPYLVMELVEGPSLRQVVNEHALGMPIGVVLTVLRGILRGIGAAHAANVVHRDLKPGNILLHLAGRPLEELVEDDVKIGDFGLGVGDPEAIRSIIVQSASIERSDQSGAIAGTLAYMAPEVRDGQQAHTPRADLYSIGVVLFEMVTGSRPAGTEQPSEVRAEAPEALDEVFSRLYARLDRRYESAEAALTDLEVRLSPPKVPPKAPRAAAAPAPTVRREKCPECKSTVEDDDQFCTQCGAQLVKQVRTCPSCGGYPGPRDRFCIFCGAEVARMEE